MKTCKFCGTPLPEGSTQCEFCGEINIENVPSYKKTTYPKGTKQLAKVFTCPYCGKQHVGRSKYCPYCGMEMKTAIINPDGKRVASTGGGFKLGLMHKIIIGVLVLVLGFGVGGYFLLAGSRGNDTVQKLFDSYINALNTNNLQKLAETVYEKNSEQYLQLIQELQVDEDDEFDYKVKVTVSNVMIEEGEKYALIMADARYIESISYQDEEELLMDESYEQILFHAIKRGEKWYFTSFPFVKGGVGNEQPYNFTTGKVFTVKFESNGGTVIEEQYVPIEEGYLQNIDNKMFKEGYTFAGWYIDKTLTERFDYGTVITSDMVLYAKWTSNSTRYTVSFVSGIDMDIPDQTLTIGQKITQPQLPSLKNIAFEGWYMDSDFTKKFDVNTEITQNIILYGKWSEVEFTYKKESDGYYITGLRYENFSWIELPSSYNGTKVVGIADRAFYKNSTLQVVEIPNSITYIGKEAFYNCNALTTITPADLAGLNIEFVGADAFEKSKWLSKILEDNDVSFYKDGFIVVGKVLYKYVPKSQEDVVQIPENIVYIADKAFAGATMTKVSLRSTVKAIGNSVFENCTRLTEVGNFKVESMGDSVFSNCERLENIDTTTLKKMGSSCFSNCKKLKTIAFSNELTKIPDSTFDGCINLQAIDLPKNLTEIGTSAFSGCISLTSFATAGNKLPATLKVIGTYAFKDCTELQTIYLHKDITTIGSKAFNGCTKIIINCEPFGSSKPSGWASDFYGDVATDKVKWGVSE